MAENDDDEEMECSSSRKDDEEMACSFSRHSKCSKIVMKVSFKDDDIIPISLCNYDISPYVSDLGQTPYTEEDLILNRATSFFNGEEPISRRNMIV